MWFKASSSGYRKRVLQEGKVEIFFCLLLFQASSIGLVFGRLLTGKLPVQGLRVTVVDEEEKKKSKTKKGEKRKAKRGERRMEICKEKRGKQMYTLTMRIGGKSDRIKRKHLVLKSIQTLHTDL